MKNYRIVTSFGAKIDFGSMLKSKNSKFCLLKLFHQHTVDPLKIPYSFYLSNKYFEMMHALFFFFVTPFPRHFQVLVARQKETCKCFFQTQNVPFHHQIIPCLFLNVEFFHSMVVDNVDIFCKVFLVSSDHQVLNVF